MTHSGIHVPDPKRDLVFERFVDLPRDLVSRAWTRPEHIKKWFTPAPWTTIDCEIDLRPGGIFRTIMRSPEGQEFPNIGCYLEVVPPERLVWTNVPAPGFRPSRMETRINCDGFSFTAVIALEPHGAGTKYTALVMHSDEDGRKQHEEMGFHDGWGKALDQLVEAAKNF